MNVTISLFSQSSLMLWSSCSNCLHLCLPHLPFSLTNTDLRISSMWPLMLHERGVSKTRSAGCHLYSPLADLIQDTDCGPFLYIIYIYIYIYIYTGCHRRKGPNFGRVFLMLNYTYIQSWTVTEIMAREVWNFDSCYTLIDYQIHIKSGRNMWFL